MDKFWLVFEIRVFEFVCLRFFDFMESELVIRLFWIDWICHATAKDFFFGDCGGLVELVWIMDVVLIFGGVFVDIVG